MLLDLHSEAWLTRMFLIFSVTKVLTGRPACADAEGGSATSGFDSDSSSSSDDDGDEREF